jgi:hemerythrin-like domain-containing protein
MSTTSLRRDHDLIEKVIKSMEATVQLLTDGKQIPESILLPVIDFTKNFTDVCHHSKEEKSLFPALEKAGLPSNMGPVAMMLMDHERSREIGTQMEESAKEYLSSGDSTKLISDMQLYVEHITEHLWKENNKLFMMAEARLQYVSEQVDKELNEIEVSKLKDLGKSREYYEQLAENLTKDVSQ